MLDGKNAGVLWVSSENGRNECNKIILGSVSRTSSFKVLLINEVNLAAAANPQ